MRTGRTFSTMPQSNSQTSPRLGGTFLLIQHRGQRVPSVSGNVIAERAGIPRRKMLNDFLHELLLFFDWQCLELGKQFCCGSTHAEILASFDEDVSCGVHPSLAMSWPFSRRKVATTPLLP
jgi:hypothetical protein